MGSRLLTVLSVSAMNNGLDSGRSESMTYDPLNRILTTQTAASSGQDCWGLNFGDDALGNLLSMSPSKCSGPNLSVSVNSYNQITNSGFSYNADGDLKNDGLNGYAWNAANELTSAAGVNYTYDGDGLRVDKSNGTLYWRSYTGQVIEETDTSGNEIRSYFFLNGRRIAWRDSSGNVYYYFADAIGSTRAVTNATGSVCLSADYYPYGQENDYTTSCSPTYKFTGYEYDSETGNYYAYARYYNPRLGRFMTPDFTLADVGSPQSLNGYSFIANNPTSYAGPREMPAVFGAPGGSSTEASVAALIAGGSSVSIAGTIRVFGGSQGWTGAASTPVPAHPLGATLQMAEAAEMEVRAFLTYLRSHAPKPASPYGSAFGAVCAAFPGAHYAASWVGEAGCGNYLPSTSSLTLPRDWPSMTPAEQVSWFYLNYWQGSFDAINGAPSASGSNTAEGLSLWTKANGFPAENDIPVGGNLLGDWLDFGFPQFDMQMFFGGGGGGGNTCLRRRIWTHAASEARFGRRRGGDQSPSGGARRCERGLAHRRGGVGSCGDGCGCVCSGDRPSALAAFLACLETFYRVRGRV